MDIAETLEAVREIDRITNKNPAVLLVMQEMKESGNVIPLITDSLVSQKKAAQILGTSANSICRWVKEGLLDYWILPGQTERRYKVSDLQHFINTQCRKGGKSNDHKRACENQEASATLARIV